MPTPPSQPPGGSQPGNSQPGNSQPGNRQPGNSQPGNSQPGPTRPGAARPGDTDDGTCPRVGQRPLPDPAAVRLLAVPDSAPPYDDALTGLPPDDLAVRTGGATWADDRGEARRAAQAGGRPGRCGRPPARGRSGRPRQGADGRSGLAEPVCPGARRDAG